MSEMTNQQYAEYVKRKSPSSPIWGDLLRAFLIGGAICALGQVITELWVLVGLEEAEAGTACSMSLVFLGALFTGLGVYDDAAKLGGAGTLVPITGFANAVVSPALEFKSEGFITGTAAKMFIIAGPVIVFGTCASIIYGLILCLIG
jgi:stage V sporulation protein AC